MMRRLLLPLLFALALSSPLQAQEQGATVLLDSLLRAEPYIDAAVTGNLKAQTPVIVVERRGGWYQVRDSQNRNGWLRMSAIRLGEGARSTGGDSGIGQTLRLLSTGRSGASGVTVATGIRGLDAADVANATPDHQAVGKLDRYQTSAAAAQRFASSAGLRSHQIDYLKEPQ